MSLLKNRVLTENIAGRNCKVAEPSSLRRLSLAPEPTDLILFLHALGMTFDKAFDAFNVTNVANSNMIGISPDSLDPSQWNYSANSEDQVWIESILLPALRLKYPSVIRFHLAGFSNGGEMTNTIAAYGSNKFVSYLQCCMTRRLTQPTATNTLPTGTHVQIAVGDIDPLVPPTGSPTFESLDAVTAWYQSIGITPETMVVPNCGHAWPGGTPQNDTISTMLGGWPATPDLTGILVASIQKWAANP